MGSQRAGIGKVDGATGNKSNGEPCQMVPLLAPHHTNAVGHSKVIVWIIHDNCKTAKENDLLLI